MKSGVFILLPLISLMEVTPKRKKLHVQKIKEKKNVCENCAQLVFLTIRRAAHSFIKKTHRHYMERKRKVRKKYIQKIKRSCLWSYEFFLCDGWMIDTINKNNKSLWFIYGNKKKLWWWWNLNENNKESILWKK